MSIRESDSYKNMTAGDACMIVEGVDECDDADTLRAAWQCLLDTGLCWQLQGWYGRTVTTLLAAGELEPPIETHKDYWGNVVPGTGVANDTSA